MRNRMHSPTIKIIRASLLSITFYVTAYFVCVCLNFLACHQGHDLIQKSVIDLQHCFITYAEYSDLKMIVLETFLTVKIHAHIKLWLRRQLNV
jgi:hypothetical protein